MKYTIFENKRGFLFVNGKYRRMLSPGKYRLHPVLGHVVLFADDLDKAVPVDVPTVDNSLLLRDPEFAACVDRIEVPDGFKAVHMQDGRIVGVLKPGAYCFWNIYHENAFLLIDLAKAEITELTPEQLMSVPLNQYIKVEVSEGEIGLLYLDGKLQRSLGSGSYYFWKNMQKIDCQKIDLRTQQLDIAGQEILTADKVSLRINFVCSYRITDPIRIVGEIKDYKTQIYVLTQLALRDYIGRFRLDELLEQKEDIAAFVLGQLQAKQDALFVAFSEAGVKDIILPGEIRDIMNTVLVAEKNAQANVIARREEVASTRSLLNTARLMDENATLYKLKELEYLEKICDKVGNISVGGGNLLSELRDILSARQDGSC